MPPGRPGPQGFVDGMIHSDKGLRAGGVPVILCPTLDERVEVQDQVAGCRRAVGLYRLPDLLQEGFDVLLGGGDVQLGAAVGLAVLADVLAQEVKAVFDMRDDRLLLGEFESSFPQEVLH